MATKNVYLNYKRETNHLVRWIVQVSNKLLINSFNTQEKGISLNTTGGITVSALVPLCKLIASEISYDEIPSAVFRLFRSIISARKATHANFEKMAAQSQDGPDPEIQESNAKHKHFIDVLVEAFEVLGGKEREASKKAKAPETNDDDLEDLSFINKFSALTVHHNPEISDESEGEHVQQVHSSASQKRRQGKGKKGKKGGKQQKKKQQPTVAPDLDNVPLESFRIIQDSEGGIMTDYLMAVYALITEWAQLRQYLQNVWRKVAHEKLNSAVAGAISNIAIAMIRRSASDMFVDFPGHESFDVVIKTITRGNIDKSQGMFGISVAKFTPEGQLEAVKMNPVDVREIFMIHAYQDLMDFITDFQCTRSGKSTKRMQNSIKDWNPKLDLELADKEERVQWRRSYTINWLYDLVNVFSSIVVQHNTLRGEHHLLEKVDWSVNGPWDKYRRIYGLKEFAGFVTSLAMQKQGTDVRNKILPHHVFQLQCIVDSMTVSRGWAVHPFKGHVISSPARNFNPRRDLDLFLDRKDERLGKGFCNGIEIVKQIWEREEMRGGTIGSHEADYAILEDIRIDFLDWLGETKYAHGELNTIPPSRFSSTNPNGLWDYSPFLCGVGLAEALDISYRAGMWVWDRHESVALIVHLHNMLVKKGYIKQPIGLYQSLQEIFTRNFFEDGKVPTKNFDDALVGMIDATGSRREEKIRVRAKRSLRGKQFGEECIMHETIRIFKEKSFLVLLREADWDLDRVSDEHMPWPSLLATIRLSRTKRIVDKATGKERLEETPMVKSLAARGLTPEQMLEISQKIGTTVNKSKQDRQAAPEWIKPQLQELYPGIQHDFRNDLRNVGSSAPHRNANGVSFDGTDLLALLQKDIEADIRGTRPLSAVNYIWVLNWVLLMWQRLEDALAAACNRVYIEAYESKPMLTGMERIEMGVLALISQDDECLKIMARELENPRVGFMHHIYWDDLDMDEKQDAAVYGFEPPAEKSEPAEPLAFYGPELPPGFKRAAINPAPEGETSASSNGSMDIDNDNNLLFPFQMPEGMSPGAMPFEFPPGMLPNGFSGEAMPFPPGMMRGNRAGPLPPGVIPGSGAPGAMPFSFPSRANGGGDRIPQVSYRVPQPGDDSDEEEEDLAADLPPGECTIM
ncbi:hypothetical protein QBC38DRAFT_512816 [Podospora fimiseda]|uniref:DUF6604 domain-containing protein n=1 Tax=Podospora fimiseda TaxID=252190 RepID=A0AAN7BFT8_9PEZI|nr:hypothetical protein QBC38DRAFT_512816 [Podospora fimiseda]